MTLRRINLFIVVQVFIGLFTSGLTAKNNNVTKNDFTPKTWNLVWSGHAKDELKEWKSFCTPNTSDDSWKQLDDANDYAKFFPGSNGEVKINQTNWNTSEWIGPDFFKNFTKVKMCLKDYPSFEINNQMLFPSNNESYIVKDCGDLVTSISENNGNLTTKLHFDKNTGKLEFDPPGINNNNNSCTVEHEIYKSNASAVVLFLGGIRQVSVTKNNGSVFNVTYEHKDGNNEFDIEVYNWSMNGGIPAKFISYTNGTDKSAKKFLLMTQDYQNHIILGLPQCKNNTINNCFFENKTISDINFAINFTYKNNGDNNGEHKKKTREEKKDNQNGIPDLKRNSPDKKNETKKADKNVNNLPESPSNVVVCNNTKTKKDEKKIACKHVSDLPESHSDVVVSDNDSNVKNDKNNPEVEKEKGGVTCLLIFIYTAIALSITAVFILGAWWLLKRHQQRDRSPGFINLLILKRQQRK